MEESYSLSYTSMMARTFKNEFSQSDFKALNSDYWELEKMKLWVKQIRAPRDSNINLKRHIENM